MAEMHVEKRLKRLWVSIGETLKRLTSTNAGRWWLVWVSGGRKWVLGSSKTVNVACLAVFDPDTKSALSRQLEIDIFVFKSGFAFEWLTSHLAMGGRAIFISLCLERPGCPHGKGVRGCQKCMGYHGPSNGGCARTNASKTGCTDEVIGHWCHA